MRLKKGVGILNKLWEILGRVWDNRDGTLSDVEVSWCKVNTFKSPYNSNAPLNHQATQTTIQTLYTPQEHSRLDSLSQGLHWVLHLLLWLYKPNFSFKTKYQILPPCTNQDLIHSTLTQCHIKNFNLPYINRDLKPSNTIQTISKQWSDLLLLFIDQ